MWWLMSLRFLGLKIQHLNRHEIWVWIRGQTQNKDQTSNLMYYNFQAVLDLQAKQKKSRSRPYYDY